MPNTRNRANLKAMVDLLSDAHQQIVDEAQRANSLLLTVDDKTKKDSNGTRAKWAGRAIERMEEEVKQQSLRCVRVLAELQQIRKNIRIPS